MLHCVAQINSKLFIQIHPRSSFPLMTTGRKIALKIIKLVDIFPQKKWNLPA